MTLTSFASDFLWLRCRRHLVGQLNRPSTQFSDSCGHLSKPNDLNFSVHRCQSASGNPQNYYNTTVPHNIATTDTRYRQSRIYVTYVCIQRIVSIGNRDVHKTLRHKTEMRPRRDRDVPRNVSRPRRSTPRLHAIPGKKVVRVQICYVKFLFQIKRYFQSWQRSALGETEL